MWCVWFVYLLTCLLHICEVDGWISGLFWGNFIYKFFPADTYVVSLDDDMEGITSFGCKSEEWRRQERLLHDFCKSYRRPRWKVREGGASSCCVDLPAGLIVFFGWASLKPWCFVVLPVSIRKFHQDHLRCVPAHEGVQKVLQSVTDLDSLQVVTQTRVSFTESGDRCLSLGLKHISESAFSWNLSLQLDLVQIPKKRCFCRLWQMCFCLWSSKSWTMSQPEMVWWMGSLFAFKTFDYTRLRANTSAHATWPVSRPWPDICMASSADQMQCTTFCGVFQTLLRPPVTQIQRSSAEFISSQNSRSFQIQDAEFSVRHFAKDWVDWGSPTYRHWKSPECVYLHIVLIYMYVLYFRDFFFRIF